MNENNALKYTRDAIHLLRNSQVGILSTISLAKDNYPFGSLVTFISGRDRTIYLYLSDIAEHTKNLKNNHKGCITILGNNEKDDAQNNSRLTLTGNLKIVESDEVEFCKERFFTLLPQSKSYANFHGFNFYKLEIKNIRWIGGFGKIGWLNENEWKSQKPKWTKNENKIINHMNEDHQDSIISTLLSDYNIDDQKVKMLFLTIDGYYAQSKYGIFFIQFNQTCNDSSEYKNELVRLAKKNKTIKNELQ